MTKWTKCDWLLEKDKRPTIPGYYRVMIAGDSESEDGYTLYEYPDHPVWATLEKPEPNYDQTPSFDSPGFINQDEPTYQPVHIFGGEVDNVIAWWGPVELTHRDTWHRTEEINGETKNLPTEKGAYIGMFLGDSEYLEGHCLYNFDDYESFFSVLDWDEEDGPDIRCMWDEEPEWIISWYGPIEIPEVDCF